MYTFNKCLIFSWQIRLQVLKCIDFLLEIGCKSVFSFKNCELDSCCQKWIGMYFSCTYHCSFPLDIPRLGRFYWSGVSRACDALFLWDMFSHSSLNCFIASWLISMFCLLTGVFKAWVNLTLSAWSLHLCHGWGRMLVGNGPSHQDLCIN